MRHFQLMNTIGRIAFFVLLLTFNACEQPQKTITYTEDIAPLLYTHCVSCHRQGGAAHFALENFNQTRALGRAIAFVTQQRMMPPWPADPHYTRFTGERLLTDDEINRISQWVDNGMPEGPKAALPEIPEYSFSPILGKPDLILPVTPIKIEANSGDHFYLVKVPFELSKVTHVSAIEFVAGKHNAVHHVNGDLISYEPGKKRNPFEGELMTDMVEDSTIRIAFEKMKLPNDDGSYPLLQKSVVNYLPGVFGIKYPKGIGGYHLPEKGAFLFNDMHYGRQDSTLIDSSYLYIYFEDGKVKRPVQEFQLGTLGVSPVEPDLKIEPNTIKNVFSRYTVPRDISVLTINPHMHLLGKSFKAYALSPGGDTIRLISIPRWDFKWQYFYTFKKPVKIPAGYTIVAEGVYDNTRANLNNPFSPPRLVQDRTGSMRSVDEMFQFIITYLPYEEGDEDIDLTKIDK